MGLFGELLAVFRRDPPPFVAQGTGGVSASGGFLISPEKSSDLVGANRFVTYDNLVLNTSIVAAAVRYYHSLMAGVGWSVKPGKGPKAAEYAERIDQMIKTEMHIPWNQVVAQLAHYKWMGFAVQEWIAERMPDGFIGLTKFENRPQHTIDQWILEDQSGDVLGWIQRHPTNGLEYQLSRAKCVYLADKSITNQPDGVGMFRHLVETNRQLKRLEQLEAWAYETDLRGVPIGRAPIGVLDELVRRKIITPAQRAEKLKGLEDFIKNHIRNPQLGILLDSMVYRDEGQAKSPSITPMWGMELAKGNGVGFAEIANAIERKNREMGRAIGFEHLMMGGDGKGSNAQHGDKTASMREGMNSTLGYIGWALDQDVILTCMDHNGWDRTQRPSLQPEALQLRSVEQVVDAIEGMARAGAVILPGDDVVNQVRDMLKLVHAPEMTADLLGMIGRGPKEEPSEDKAPKKEAA